MSDRQVCKGCGKFRLFMCQHSATGLEPAKNCGYCVACCPDRAEFAKQYPESEGALIIRPVQS